MRRKPDLSDRKSENKGSEKERKGRRRDRLCNELGGVAESLDEGDVGMKLRGIGF